MNLDKYNKRLLAILGTTIIAAFGIGIISALIAFISSLNFNNTRARDNGIVIDQNQIIDTTSTTLTQNISILEPYQLDSSKPVFLIPIGQKDQSTRRRSVQGAGMSFASYETTDDYYYSSFTGLYNNFVLIDYTRNIKSPLFKKKIAITEWAYMKVDSSQLVLFKGTDTDLNKDGLLNDNDFQSLFVFNISSLELTQLEFKNQTVRNFEPLSLTSKIYVRTGKDINKDKKFNSYKEPTDLYFYDIRTGEKETLVPENVKMEIQEILSK